MPEGYGKDVLNCALSLTSDVLEFIPGVGNVKDVFDLVVDSIDAVKTAWEISNKIREGYNPSLITIQLIPNNSIIRYLLSI